KRARILQIPPKEHTKIHVTRDPSTQINRVVGVGMRGDTSAVLCKVLSTQRRVTNTFDCIEK
ncbi:hypothetical protein J6590_098741, partial [Homalodisca vitripennis]